MNESSPQHGDTRSTGSQTTYGAEVVFLDARTREEVYRGPGSSSTTTTGEVYCAVCAAWVPYQGLMGALRASRHCPACGAPMTASPQAAGQA